MSTVTPGQKAGSESLKPHGSFRTFWRAWWVREDEQLTAEESASTLFRFFRSKHVIDLRLIAKLAGWLFCLYFLFLAPSIFLDTDLKFPFKMFAGFFGPAVPIYGAIVAWAYMSAETRLGVVDLFACEISTICRVGTIFDIGKRHIAMYHGSSDIENGHKAAKRIELGHVRDEESSRSFTSNENYFPIFDSNSSDLQSLQALVVRHITEYYTYMKAARDLQRKLASLDPTQISKSSESAPDDPLNADQWHETLASIIYVLFLGYESARKSINDLIEFQPARAENTIVILLTELSCYSFLCIYHKKYRKDEVRLKRLQLREADYREIVPALIASVNAVHQGNEKYWALAKRTIPELANRYNAMLETLQNCVGR